MVSETDVKETPQKTQYYFIKNIEVYKKTTILTGNYRKDPIPHPCEGARIQVDQNDNVTDRVLKRVNL